MTQNKKDGLLITSEISSLVGGTKQSLNFRNKLPLRILKRLKYFDLQNRLQTGLHS